MMIYCNIKKKNDNSAIYLFGTSTNDITGEAEFFSTFTEPKIFKQPETRDVPLSQLSRIVVKYRSELTHGKFPERMSYER